MCETKVEFMRIRSRIAGGIAWICVSALFSVFLLASQLAFAQDVPEAESGEIQESMLVWRAAFSKEFYTVSGRDIFVVNLSLKRFLASYRSKDEAERSAAHAFLLGVLDATEGTAWCSYRQYKSITILVKIHSGLKDLEVSHSDERAARVITGFLKKHWPCKEH
jgi:hypothetical protein